MVQVMPIPTAYCVQNFREPLKDAAISAVQSWAADTRREGFAQECKRQSRIMRGDALETETHIWLEAVGDTDG